MVCNKNHRYNLALSELPKDQGGTGRHKCAGCAYELGLEDGLNGLSMRNNFDNLPESQAGTGRHKDVRQAYLAGYREGKQKQVKL